MSSKLVFVVLFAAAVCAATSALPQDTDKDLVNIINRIDNEPSLPLFAGLRVDRVESGRSFGSAGAKESFLDRTERYMESHELNFGFGSEEDEETAGNSEAGRGMEEGRTRRVRKLLLPLLLALKLKKALVFKVLFTIVKFISLKSLIISIIALIFAGSTFFKDLLAKKKDHVTTAYISAPANAEIVHSDWNRNGQASAQELAYNYHALPQQGVY